MIYVLIYFILNLIIAIVELIFSFKFVKLKHFIVFLLIGTPMYIFNFIKLAK